MTAVNENYTAPSSNLVKPADEIVGKDILTEIKTGWITLLISAGCTAALNAFRAVPVGTGQWIDVFLALIFAFGVYRKSRTAAVLNVLFALLGKYLQLAAIIESGKTDQLRPGFFITGTCFILVYCFAVRGTFRYHRAIKAHNQ